MRFGPARPLVAAWLAAGMVTSAASPARSDSACAQTPRKSACIAACGATGDDVCCLLDDDGMRTCLGNKATDAKDKQDWPRRYDLLNAIARMPRRPTANFWKEFAQAAENTGHFREAVSAAEQCRKEAKDPAMAKECAELAQRIEQTRFGTVTVVVPAPVPDLLVVVDGKRVELDGGSGTVSVTPGSVVVTAVAPSHARYSEVVTVTAGKNQRLTVELEPLTTGAVGSGPARGLVLDVGLYLFTAMVLNGGLLTAPGDVSPVEGCRGKQAQCAVTTDDSNLYVAPGFGGLHLLLGGQVSNSLSVNGLVIWSPLNWMNSKGNHGTTGSFVAAGPGVLLGNPRAAQSSVAYGMGLNLMLGAAQGIKEETSMKHGDLYSVRHPNAPNDGEWKTQQMSGPGVGGTLTFLVGYRPWAGFGLRIFPTVLYGIGTGAYVIHFPVGIGFGVL